VAADILYCSFELIGYGGDFAGVGAAGVVEGGDAEVLPQQQAERGSGFLLHAAAVPGDLRQVQSHVRPT
jgi:hypothetical protein